MKTEPHPPNDSKDTARQWNATRPVRIVLAIRDRQASMVSISLMISD